MSKHTKEPWILAPQSEPYEDLKIVSGHRAVCKLWLDDAPVRDYNETQEANARRIVACVNACAGLPSESLDLITSTTIGMVGYVKQRDAARKQRDDLLAALTSIVYKNSTGEYKNSFIDETVLNDLVAEAIETVDDILELLPGSSLMDPPDGGSVSIPEQIKRLIESYEQKLLAKDEDFAQRVKAIHKSYDPLFIKF